MCEEQEEGERREERGKVWMTTMVERLGEVAEGGGGGREGVSGMEDVGRGGGGGQEGEGVRGAEVMDCCSHTGHYILLHSHLS